MEKSGLVAFGNLPISIIGHARRHAPTRMPFYMKLAFTCTVLLMLISLFTQARAQETQPSGERPQRSFDREGGGGGGRGGPMGRMNPLLQALDADKNGELSAEEIANAPAALKKLDKNGDGKLTADELRPAFREGERGGPRADNSAEVLASLMGFDKNADGKLTADELPERMKNIIARADTDKDGAATKEELTKFLASQNSNREPNGPRAERPQRLDSEDRH